MDFILTIEKVSVLLGRGHVNIDFIFMLILFSHYSKPAGCNEL